MWAMRVANRAAMTATTYRRRAKLLEAELGSELVALDADSGQCFGFNEVASSVWRSLEQPKTFEQLRDALLEEYDVDSDECSSQLHELLEDLTSKGLIARNGNNGG
jgi:hypothetical protein